MKKSCFINSVTGLLVAGIIVVNLTGCAAKIQATNLMESVTANEVEALENLNEQGAVVTDFAVRLFKESRKTGENTLISPLSVLCAVAMTMNGAKEETLTQMEETLGMTAEDMNRYFYSYMKSLPQEEENKLNLANSIWFTDDDRFTVNQDFLQVNADYYGANIYKAPFDDQTLKDINNWVKEKTDDMIPKILDEIPEDAVMYLVNALAFEAEWAQKYEKKQVKDGEFTREDGTKQEAEFMHSFEELYLEDDNATGFIKYYKGRQYAFAALLPNEGVSVSEYVDSLDGEELYELLSNPQEVTVEASIPKFETGYTTEMKDVLKAMGINDAFDDSLADFSGLGSSNKGNIYISRVIHKTFISVEEQGTKAGAVTVIENKDTASVEIDSKVVCLDRPFVYMLIDCENNFSFFIGTMMDLEK